MNKFLQFQKICLQISGFHVKSERGALCYRESYGVKILHSTIKLKFYSDDIEFKINHSSKFDCRPLNFRNLHV